jgi:hypothetical protein
MVIAVDGDELSAPAVEPASRKLRPGRESGDVFGDGTIMTANWSPAALTA